MNDRKTRKKGQMEIFGLAIIVIIIVIGFIFALKYFNQPKQKGTSGDKQAATAFMNALLSDKLEVEECKLGVELKEMIQDCTANHNNCAATGAGPGTTYCDKAKEIIRGKILPETFTKRGTAYEFEIREAEGDTIMQEKHCQGKKTKVPVQYFLPTSDRVLVITLTLCN